MSLYWSKFYEVLKTTAFLLIIAATKGLLNINNKFSPLTVFYMIMLEEYYNYYFIQDIKRY